ncbi:MAG: MarC family protein [Fibrobacterota bacterium]|nr:MarC family protein [Chitinispirillaceae bacterium]
MDFKAFWLCFVPLFIAVDAIGTLPIFMSLTEGLDGKNRVKVIVSSVITALLVGILFLFVGDAILKMLGITVEDFMIAGGIILFMIAVSDILMFNKAHKKVSAEALGSVPIGVPLIVGPAVLTTVMLLVRQEGFFYTGIAVTFNILIAGLIFLLSGYIMKLLGASGTKIVSKIASLFLAAIGVMMVRKGLSQLIGS